MNPMVPLLWIGGAISLYAGYSDNSITDVLRSLTTKGVTLKRGAGGVERVVILISEWFALKLLAGAASKLIPVSSGGGGGGGQPGEEPKPAPAPAEGPVPAENPPPLEFKPPLELAP